MPVFDQERVNRLKQILKWNPRGISISDLATKMEMNRNLVAKYLDILLISGQVEMQVIGAAKVYFLSQRVPISSMLEFSSDMLIILDSALTIMQVNEPVLVQADEKREALAGRNIKDLDHPFFSAIPVTIPFNGTDFTHDQVSEFECTIEGKKNHYKIKQLQTAFEDGSQGITLIIEDITAQVTYQKMLEINEAKYRGIVEDQTEFITRFLPDRTLVFVNDAYARYFGKEKEKLLGELQIPDIESDDRTTVHQCIESLDAENSVKTFECRIHHSCGQLRWNQWTVRALFGDKQKPIEYQGVGRDITEQKEAEAKIRQYIADIEYLSQKSYEFLEHSPDADIYGTICRGVKDILPKAIVLVNSFDHNNDATTRSVLGDEERLVFGTLMGGDIIGKIVKPPKNTSGDHAVKVNRSGRIVKVPGNLFIATQKQVPEAVCAKIEETLNIGDIYLVGLVSQGIILADVVIMLQKGDKLGHVDLIEAYVRQAANALLRQKTAETLRESEKLYRSVIENIQDVFYRSDTEGVLIMASPCWAKMLGYDSLNDCIGYNIAEKFYFVPQLRKEFLDAVYRNGSVSDYEVVLKCRDGTPLNVSTNSHLYYDDAGSLLGVEGIFRTISKRNAKRQAAVEKNTPAYHYTLHSALTD